MLLNVVHTSIAVECSSLGQVYIAIAVECSSLEQVYSYSYDTTLHSDSDQLLYLRVLHCGILQFIVAENARTINMVQGQINGRDVS